MPSPTDYPTTGRVIAIKDGFVVFNPRGTRYELHLKHSGDAPPLNTPLEAIICASARKVWTVPSGGNFITPIVGSSRIVQGRVKFMTDREVVVGAGANFVIELPSAESAVDLPNGAIAIGVMVNATLLTGAWMEFVTQESIKSVR